MIWVPAAWTPVCSDQWPGYNIARPFFDKYDAVLLGITVDNIPTLFAWTRQMGDLWFPVLSDFWPHGVTAQAYGCFNDTFGVSMRATYVLDADGNWRIWTPPDTSGAADWTIEGGPEGVLVSQSDTYSRADTYNGVVMTSETLKGGKPVRAFVVDDDPASPTFWDGPFGHKILFTDVPPIAGTSDDDIIQRAEKAARAVLSEYKGSARELSFASVPNPAVEVGDIIEVEIGGVVQTHVLDTLSVPLGASGSLEGGSRLGREV